MQNSGTRGRELAVPARWRLLTFASVPTVLVGATLFSLIAGCDGDDGPSYNPYGVLAPLPQDSPRFRGADGQGVSTETGVPTTWDDATGQNILWKVPVPLPGAGSPVVCGDRVFLSGADETNREIYCFHADTGELLWQEPVVASGEPRIQYESYDAGTFAAATVACDGVCVFAIFGNGDLACFDYEGTKVWTVNLGPPGSPIGPEVGYGHGTSLLVYQSLLIVQLDQGSAGEDKSRLMALSVRSGRTVWQKAGADRPVGVSWTTPILINAAGKDQLITCSNPWIIAYDPATGSEIWKSDYLSGNVAVSPVYVPPSGAHPNGLVVVVPNRSMTVAISPDATGEVPMLDGAAWFSYDAGSEVPSPVTDGQYLFIVSEYGRLDCLDAATGSMAWPSEQDLYQSGVYYYPSPVLADNRVYLLRDDGITVIFTAQGTAYQEVGRPQLGATETYNASPAVVNGRIYIRGSQNLYCIGN